MPNTPFPYMRTLCRLRTSLLQAPPTMPAHLSTSVMSIGLTPTGGRGCGAPRCLLVVTVRADVRVASTSVSQPQKPSAPSFSCVTHSDIALEDLSLTLMLSRRCCSAMASTVKMASETTRPQSRPLRQTQDQLRLRGVQVNATLLCLLSVILRYCQVYLWVRGFLVASPADISTLR